MIARIGFDELRELARLFPVKLAALDDNAAKCRAVPADKFSRAVDDNIRAEFKRANLIGRGERVINDERDFMLVRNVGDGLNINERGVGIADGVLSLIAASKTSTPFVGSTKVVSIPKAGSVCSKRLKVPP